eukprot:XP_011660948.1 PREDICTED: uncharacterized protein LOC105436748 [Strongylocentrotus purpuratus]
MMMNRFWYLACLVFGSLMLVVHHASSQESSFSVSLSSVEPVLPCIYRGIPFLHGEVWDIGPCETCTCDNGTTTCNIESCRPVFCAEPLERPGECCAFCPYDVTVRKVKPTIRSKGNVTTNGDATLVLAVEVKFKDTRKTTGVSGESLWELSAWIAPVNTTHSNTRLDFTKQVLNIDQASQGYIKGDQFIFRDVVYPSSALLLNCDEANVCVELKRGKNAVATDDRPFNVSSFPKRSTSLIGCTSLCTDVTVRNVNPTIQSQRSVTSDGDATIVLAVEVKFRDARSTTVQGKSLWELSAWIAHKKKNKSHTRIGFTEQVLNVDQASQWYIKGNQFIFRDVVYTFVDPSLNCDDANVCVELKRGRNAVTTDDRLFNISSDPDSSTPFIGCTSLCTGRK